MTKFKTRLESTGDCSKKVVAYCCLHVGSSVASLTVSALQVSIRRRTDGSELLAGSNA